MHRGLKVNVKKILIPIAILGLALSGCSSNQDAKTESGHTVSDSFKREATTLETEVPTNTCRDGSDSRQASFDIHEATLIKTETNSITVNLLASYWTQQRVNYVEVSVFQGGKADLILTLRNNAGLQTFSVGHGSRGFYLDDYEQLDYQVNVSGTRGNYNYVFSGPEIEKFTKGSFRWAIGTRGINNVWDLCPEQELSIPLRTLQTYEE